MITVAEIKAAIDHLTFEEKSQLMAMLNPLPDDEWDTQMKADATAGKFDQLKEEAESERKTGTLLEFPAGS